MALYLVDRERNELFGYRDKSPPEAVASQEFFYAHRLSLTGRSGMIGRVYRRKHPLYVSTFAGIAQTETDRTFIRNLNLKSLMTVPLVLDGALIGVVSVSHYGRTMDLTDSQVKSIVIFCEQIVGAIHNALLLKEAREAHEAAEAEKRKSESLLHNILPLEIADELKRNGSAEPVYYDSVTVMFTDFQGFTAVAERLTPKALVAELDMCFSYFDSLMDRYNLEKLKTIGDSYMCAGGIPVRNTTHPVDCVLAALEIQAFMNQMKSIKESQGLPYWELRLGIHSGPLIAGVIGEKKFAYDVWSDTVNTASRMESSGIPGRINISGTIHDLVENFFECDYRGKVPAKNKGEIDMFFVNGLRKELSREGDGRTPNETFHALYETLAILPGGRG